MVVNSKGDYMTIQGKYRCEIQKIEQDYEFYVLRVYENDDIVMSTVDYLDNIYDAATHWLVKN